MTTYTTAAASNATAGTKLYRFAIGHEWKGQAASYEVIASNKDDAHAYALANSRSAVGMPKTSIQRIAFLATV